MFNGGCTTLSCFLLQSRHPAEQVHEFGALRTDCTHGMWRQKEASSGIPLEDERLILSFCQKFIGSQNGD